MSKRKGWIPEEVFRSILEYSPRSTVDMVITRRTPDGQTEFLLAKRLQRPSRGQWFIPGGSIQKGERMEHALYRQLGRELNVTLEDVGGAKFLGYLDFFGVNDQNIRYHSVMHIFEVRIKFDAVLRSNAENGSVKWFREINRRWRKTVRTAVKMAGFD